MRQPPTGTVCGYCFERPACCYDHMVPRSFGGSNAASNLMPACQRCNAVLSDLVFDTIEERRAYVQGVPVVARGALIVPAKERPGVPIVDDDAKTDPLPAGCNGWGSKAATIVGAAVVLRRSVFGAASKPRIVVLPSGRQCEMRADGSWVVW